MPNKPNDPRPIVGSNAEPSLDNVARVIARMLLAYRERQIDEKLRQVRRDG